MAKRRANDREEIAGQRGVPAERITINGWWPAHCDCFHEQSFDDLEPINTVEWYRTVVGTVHAVGGNTKDTWEADRNEDARYGRSHEAIMNVLGITREALEEQKALGDYTWTWLEDRLTSGVGAGIGRVLDVAVPNNISNQNVNQIQSTLDAQFGAGAIVVHK